VNYSRAPLHPEEALRLVARVPAGREVLEAFLPLYRASRVVFEAYEPALLLELRSALGEGQPVGASFTIEESGGVIRFDPAAPIGVLAPFLLHEMVHALDARLWRASGKAMARRSRDRLMLEAETRAFEAQHRFVEQLRAADPAYHAFLLKQQARVAILHEKLTQEDIARLYGLAKAN
jgi:hypothetical protein